MTISQMSSSSAPAQQQGSEQSSKPATKLEARREGAAPQQMQAASPTPRFTDWASI